MQRRIVARKIPQAKTPPSSVVENAHAHPITPSRSHARGNYLNNDIRVGNGILGKRRRKMLQQKKLQIMVFTKNAGMRSILIAGGILFMLGMKGLFSGSGSKPMGSAKPPYRNKARDYFVPADLDHALYRQVYVEYQENRDEHEDQKRAKDKSKGELGVHVVRSLDTYGKEVLEHTKCHVTVLFMDPRFPHFPRGHPAWFALESVGKFLPNACVLIQTSKCSFPVPVEGSESTSVRESEGGSDKDEPTVESAIYQRIYDTSLPLFQDMISRGHVRVTFLNHTKYDLEACDNYANPSSAMMNIHYWSDMDHANENENENGSETEIEIHGEYIAGVDSDTVLVMQDDAVICHEMDLSLYKQYAYVGGVFRKFHPFMQNHKLCHELFIRWAMFLGKKMGDDSTGMEHFMHFCGGDGSAPIGNGGFSLRSRSAMRSAIETCPNERWSGIISLDAGTDADTDIDVGNETSHNPASSLSLPCQSKGSMNEDIYFATILRGTGALMPSAFDAALFSVEQLWPEESLDQYRGPTELEERVRTAMDASTMYRGSTLTSAGRRSWWNFWMAEDVVHRDDTVPFGFHKPWWYFEVDLLQSKDLNDQCPLLQYMFHPRDSRAGDLVKNVSRFSGFGKYIKEKLMIGDDQTKLDKERLLKELLNNRKKRHKTSSSSGSHSQQVQVPMVKKKKKKKKRKKLGRNRPHLRSQHTIDHADAKDHPDENY